MIYPNFIKKDEIIGICAPSAGVGGKKESFDSSIKTIKSYGFKIKETESVRNDSEPSAEAKIRGKEFNDLIKDKSVKMIMSASGGDYNIEMLPFIDEEAVKANPKWVMGASDPTNILYYLTTKLDIATLYGHNAGSFDILPLHESQLNTFKIIQGDLVKQNSCDKYDGNPSYDKEMIDYNTDVYWTALAKSNSKLNTKLNYNDIDIISSEMTTEKQNDEINDKIDEITDGINYDIYKSLVKISGYNIPANLCHLIPANGYSEATTLEVSGRLIGGCSDCILNLIGTRYDGTRDFINKYHEDGIIWYFDPFMTSAPDLYRLMLQMKYCGYFKYTKAIIFGRIMFKEGSSDSEFIEKITKCFTEYDSGDGYVIPIIWNADIGHVKPSFTLINGAMANLRCQGGNASIEMFIR